MKRSFFTAVMIIALCLSVMVFAVGCNNDETVIDNGAEFKSINTVLTNAVDSMNYTLTTEMETVASGKVTRDTGVLKVYGEKMYSAAASGSEYYYTLIEEKDGFKPYSFVSKKATDGVVYYDKKDWALVEAGNDIHEQAKNTINKALTSALPKMDIKYDFTKTNDGSNDIYIFKAKSGEYTYTLIKNSSVDNSFTGTVVREYNEKGVKITATTDFTLTVGNVGAEEIIIPSTNIM